MPSLVIKHLGLQDYTAVWRDMQNFTNSRDENTADELWCVEHPPVFTQGQAGKDEHILNPGNIPVIPVDRGGQVTYHGPGQLVMYPLIDIRRMAMGVRCLVSHLENAVIDVLANYAIEAHSDRDAPGVYIASGAKICSVGLRIRKGRSFHGLALNVATNLTPFLSINPCGYAGLEVTSMHQLGVKADMADVTQAMIHALSSRLGYNSAQSTV